MVYNVIVHIRTVFEVGLSLTKDMVWLSMANNKSFISALLKQRVNWMRNCQILPIISIEWEIKVLSRARWNVWNNRWNMYWSSLLMKKGMFLVSINISSLLRVIHCFHRVTDLQLLKNIRTIYIYHHRYIKQHLNILEDLKVLPEVEEWLAKSFNEIDRLNSIDSDSIPQVCFQVSLSRLMDLSEIDDYFLSSQPSNI